MNASFNHMTVITGRSIASGIAKSFPLIHARRDVLLGSDADLSTKVFYDSALIGNNWIDIDPIESREIFTEMIRGIVNGSLTSEVSLKRAALSLEQIYR